MASKNDHSFSGGSKIFNFTLCITVSHYPDYMFVHYLHVPPWFFTQAGKKVLETCLSFSDKLYPASQVSYCATTTLHFSF